MNSLAVMKKKRHQPEPKAGDVTALPEKKARDPFDVKLGIEGSCIGLRRPAEPARREIFHHQPFY